MGFKKKKEPPTLYDLVFEQIKLRGTFEPDYDEICFVLKNEVPSRNVHIISLERTAILKGSSLVREDELEGRMECIQEAYGRTFLAETPTELLNRIKREYAPISKHTMILPLTRSATHKAEEHTLIGMILFEEDKPLLSKAKFETSELKRAIGIIEADLFLEKQAHSRQEASEKEGNKSFHEELISLAETEKINHMILLRITNLSLLTNTVAHNQLQDSIRHMVREFKKTPALYAYAISDTTTALLLDEDEREVPYKCQRLVEFLQLEYGFFMASVFVKLANNPLKAFYEARDVLNQAKARQVIGLFYNEQTDTYHLGKRKANEEADESVNPLTDNTWWEDAEEDAAPFVSSNEPEDDEKEPYANEPEKELEDEAESVDYNTEPIQKETYKEPSVKKGTAEKVVANEKKKRRRTRIL